MIRISGIAIFLSLITFLMVQCNSDNQAENTNEEKTSEACCDSTSCTDKSETSDITCPECGHKKTETLPTDVCTIKYTCEECGYEMTPKEGDCCVFCTYGTHKCPSKQEP